MEAWKNLVSSCLLGTERQATAPVVAEGNLGKVLQRLEQKQQSREAAMLDKAAVIHLYLKAASPPSDYGANIELCPDEDKPEASGNANVLLMAVLQPEKLFLLKHWLVCAQEKGKRLPHSRLAEALDFATKHSDAREYMLPVLGHRGQWLAQKNSDWSWAAQGSLTQNGITAETARRIWDTGEPDERKNVLAYLRKTSPATARELLQSTWKEETYQNKASFVELLIEELSDDDEPFLEEEALNDKRKEVRTAAITCLLKLKNSRLVSRMCDRLQGLASVSGNKIDFQLPQQCDKAMQRDGVEGKSFEYFGEKQGWLFQIIASVPPSWWQEQFKLTPERLCDIANMDKDWQRLLFLAWERATLIHKDRHWAVCLLSRSQHVNQYTLFEMLEPADREQHIEHLISANGGRADVVGWDQKIVETMRLCTHPWSRRFSELALSAVKRSMSGNNRSFHTRAAYLFHSFGLFIHLDFAQAAVAGNPQTEEWKEAYDEFCTIMQLRKDIQAALSA